MAKKPHPLYGNDPLWLAWEELKETEHFANIRGHVDNPVLPDTRENMLSAIFREGWEARGKVTRPPTKERCPPGSCQYTLHYGAICGKCGRRYDEHDLRELVIRLRNTVDHYACKYGYSDQTRVLLNQALFALNRTEPAVARRKTRKLTG